jgi:hypothetical protein
LVLRIVSGEQIEQFVAQKLVSFGKVRQHPDHGLGGKSFTPANMVFDRRKASIRSITGAGSGVIRGSEASSSPCPLVLGGNAGAGDPDRIDVARIPDVIQRIGVQDQEIGELSLFECSGLVRNVQRSRASEGG